MSSQGFNNHNQFRAQLDKQLNDGGPSVKGYQPKRSNNSKPLSPPKKP